jgi:aldose 1-epimerase
MIELTCGPLSLAVNPHIGASVAYFRHRGAAMLRETAPDEEDGRAYAAFPLVPFSNRIRAGRFWFNGHAYQLGRDAEDPRHALHGTARFFPWAVLAQGPDFLECGLDYTPQNLDWPFAYQAWQRFELLPDRLRLTIGLRNMAEVAAPFGIGWHPYFVRRAAMKLRFSAGYVWEKDGEDIPVRAAPDAGRFDFNHWHAVDGPKIDNNYGGFGGRVEISRPGLAIAITASRVFSELVLFTPEGKDYLAMEPVSHRPDAVNVNGDAHDRGMTVLEPGEMMEGIIDIASKGFFL